MRKLKKHLGLSISRYNTFKAMMSVGILVFLICSILFIVFFNRISKEQKNKFLTLNEYLVSIVQTQFQNALNYSTTVILDPANQKIITGQIENDDLYNYSIRLNSFTNTNPLVDTLFVYYPEIDLVVCNSGFYTLKEFYLVEYGYHMRNGFEKWRSYILNNNTGFSYDPDFENILNYTRVSTSKNKANESNYKQITVFNFDLTGLSIEDNKSFIDEIGFYINDNLILIKENDNNDHITSFLESGEKYSSDIAPIKYLNSFLYVNILPYSNVYLITSMDISSYQNSMIYFILATVLTLIVSFVLSLTYSLRTSKKLFKPFRDLAYKLSPNKYSKDSLKIINEKIDSLLEEETYKDERIKKQFDDVQNLFLINLLSFYIPEKKCNLLLKKYDIIFTYSSFIVIVSEDERVNKLLKSFKNELFYDIECQTYLLEHEKNLVGVINLEEDIEIKKYISEELENVLRINSIKVNDIQLKISDLCLSIGDIYYGYQQCKYLLRDRRGIQYYTDYTNLVLQDLKKAFEEENISLYHKCIDTVFQNNMYLPSYLLVNLIKEIKQYDDKFDIEIDKNIRISKEAFLSVIKGKTKTNDSQKTIVDKVNNIIDKSFKDDSLGLYSISDELNVSNTYLSTIYKETCGIGIVQQINKKRIEFAKQLLLNTDKSVKEVALESGFSSDISFIRVFKKMEDSTPGKLRKNNNRF
ncbi:MAG: helix-turn-helix domain-containing protein [Pleomorphochaeta sp.]